MIYRINLLILLVVAMTAITAGCAPEAALKTCKVKLAKGRYANDPWIYIPVAVGDSMYNFIFDTGSTFTILDTNIVKNIQLKKSITLRNKRISKVDSVYRQNIDIYQPYLYDSLKRYGGKEALLIDSFSLQGGVMFSTDYNMIGKAAIQSYSWLFDFSADTVTISNGDIALPILPGEEVLTLKCSLFRRFIGKPKVKKMTIAIKDKAVKCSNIYFDTGSSYWFQYNRDTLMSVDMLYTWDLFKKIYDNYAVEKVKYNPKLLKGAIFDFRHIHTQVNNVNLESISIVEVPDNGEHNSYITANFARRFRMVYFDKKRGQVQLIGRNPHYERMVNIKQFPEGYMQKYAR